ncbi:DUF3592 domain-containing protein [Flavobacterium capsici]|uniref:DUF3592 domain-containing protein n=1 Tax=Flavobacterium capsici TaxID=3075618 RepID=A0AA96EXK2_9FLAO|nr:MULTISPECIES: DUF3592 domain-containing protein [unclassified Flavobacterium]WNM20359.1 DUF3592 domain-containing protein [Flavobacterium sp. PMR2A8]WNM21749.1 DUF3592 domain-containing protein [Flavobacterium sp. PMTSA4]
MNETLNIALKIVIVFSTIVLLYKIGSVVIFYFFTIKKWSEVEGTIISSDVVYFRSKTDADTQGWKEAVIYSFKVNMIEYNGNCISKNLGFLFPFKYQAKQSNFIEGQKIKIYYNPENPNQSVLDSKFDLMSCIILLGILIIFYFVVF